MARAANNQANHTAKRQGSVHASGLVGYPHPGSRACCTFPSVAWGYGWFTEGFDTLDLKEAKALLHELE